MIDCLICNEKQKSSMNLSKHLSNRHKYSPKKYYDLHLKRYNEDICVICGNETEYIGFTKGYNNTCSRKCGAILFRKELKEDNVKFEKFRSIVSSNQKKIWQERSQGVKDIIHKKAGNTYREKNLLLTEEEKKERFGWLNRLSSKEKEQWKNEIMFQTGAYLFWKNANEEDRREQQEERCKTMIENGTMISPDKKSLKQKYYDRVRSITAKNYKKYKEIINPNNFVICRGNKGYHIDHIVSIQQGFLNNIPPEVIGSIHNLQVISGKENNKKSYKNGQSIEQLLEKYNE